MYSQTNEEAFIIDYFRDYVGMFIDIGAYDVFQFSNTRALYENGWQGRMVEPAPRNYEAIADHYKNNDLIKVFKLAIGVTDDVIDFYESNGDAVGTTDKAHMEKWASAGVQYKKIQVLQMAVDKFMNLYGKDCDFLSIDTESTNMQLFRAMPLWVWEQIKMLCIEHDGCTEEIQNVLEPYGFKTLYTNAENIILAK